MAYFKSHYNAVRLPIADESGPGLRLGQLGATHAICGHFTVRHEPAIVSMPTGSGKTGVLLLSAFLERAERVLVVTPSKLIRSQVAREYRSLRLLKDIGVLPPELGPPEVVEATHRLGDAAAWEALRDADVVVATPNTASPAYADVARPPDDLFDLLLVDEAHHSPAATWRGLLDSFPTARRALFTATPFRQDRREIKGHLVYYYPLRQAMTDGIYGRIRFSPVKPAPGVSPDVAIAKATERSFRADRKAGFDHNVMVRTDGLARAKYLADVYETQTTLRLEVVSSQHSFRRVLQAVEKMRAKELDGIICVDMFGEGFDFPSFKIAAVHAPHKSLAVTLQFIGRFARTAGERLGEATFLAIPSEIEIETHRLYEEDAAWDELVVNLSEGRMAEEAEVRETIARFEAPSERAELTEDVSLYSLRPYCHVKVYQVSGGADVTRPLAFRPPVEVVHRQVSHDLGAAVVITRDVQPSRWSPQSDFARSESDLFVLYYDADTALLFINSSRRKNVSLYEEIAETVCDGEHQLVPVPMIDRVLAGVDNPDFYNIGMKSRMLSSSRESYRIMTGPSAQRAITRGDARSYFRGHVQGRGKEGGEDVTIGYSSSSKVWSHRNVQIPEFLRWCRHVAAKIAAERTVRTGSELDLLSAGVMASGIPAEVLAADWPKDVYQKVPTVVLDGRELNLTDSTLRVDRSLTEADRTRFIVEFSTVDLVIDYAPTGAPMFTTVGGWDDEVQLRTGNETVRLIDHINDDPLYVYLRDGSQLHGRQLVPRTEALPPFDPRSFEHRAWTGVDITNECKASGTKGRSIQAALEAELVASDARVVFFDHGPGEMGDFLAVYEEAGEAEVRVYHCKGSSEDRPGARVADVYEVCGQALKCTRWLNEERLLAQVRRRQARGSRFAKGDFQALEQLLRRGTMLPRYRVVIVQPGLAGSKVSDDIGAVLGLTDEALRRENLQPLLVVGSE